MVAFLAIGLVVGAIPNWRFEALVVIPAMVLTWLFDSNPAQQFTVGSTLLSGTLFAAALQLGYFGGAAARSLFSFRPK